MDKDKFKADPFSVIKESIDKCLETKIWYKDGECSFIFRPNCPYSIPYKENDEHVKYKCKYWKS